MTASKIAVVRFCFLESALLEGEKSLEKIALHESDKKEIRHDIPRTLRDL
jgi:hypothetical protein